MAEWNRIDYDQLEASERWQIGLISRDPVRGISPSLIAYLLFALVLLAFSR